jgi:hypothetical protein
MKTITKLTVKRLQKGQTEAKTVTFDDVVEYGFNQANQLYVKVKGVLSTETPGNFTSPMTWIPADEIVEFTGQEVIEFENEQQRVLYMKTALRMVAPEDKKSDAKTSDKN